MIGAAPLLHATLKDRLPPMTEPYLMSAVQTAPAPAGGANQFIIGLVPWLLIFVIFWFMMIRPQQRRMRQHQATIAAVKRGDEVVTGGGIRGHVTKVDDTEAEVEIANGVRIRVIKSTLSAVLTSGTKPAND